jgi:hypothetical protein
MSEAHDWMRARPDNVKEAMRKFPPSCRVVATQELHVPGPGRVGRVYSYLEKKGTVMVTVVDEDVYFGLVPGGIKAECQLEWLRVLQYDGNKTPEWVDRVLAGEDIEPENPGLEKKIEGPMATEMEA